MSAFKKSEHAVDFKALLVSKTIKEQKVHSEYFSMFKIIKNEERTHWKKIQTLIVFVRSFLAKRLFSGDRRMFKKSGLAFTANSFLIVAILVLIGLQSVAQSDTGWVVLDPAEAGANISSRYTVTVNGVAVPVIKIQGNNVPSYVHFSFAGKVEVKVKVNETVNSYTLTPKSYGISSSVQSGNTITFSLDKPRHLILHHVNSSTESLAIFAESIEENAPQLGGSGVINIMDYGVDNSGNTDNSSQIQTAISAIPLNGILYFPPGKYTANNLACNAANSTIYIAAGAVIQSTTNSATTTLFNIDADNVTIKGRGVLDGHGDVNRAAGRMYDFLIDYGNNWTLEGVILRNSDAWNIQAYGSTPTFKNVKWITNMDYINTDGIGTTNTGITVDDCIIMNTDDAFALHTIGSGDFNCNTHINNTVVFSQVGGARMFLLGFYNTTGITSNWNAENIDHANGYRIMNNTTGNVFEVWAQGAGGITDCNFNNIRSENTANSLFAGVTYWDFSAFGSSDKGNGKMSNIHFNEIQQDQFGAIGSSPWPNGNNTMNNGWYPANNSGNTIDSISFANYFVNGSRIINTSQGQFSIGNYVTNITFPTASNSKININATDLIADDGGSNPGQFTISRTGSTSSSLTVFYTIHGTAVNGTDYSTISNSVTIPAGSSSATITITPKPNGGGANYKTVFLSLVQNSNYMMDANYHAIVTIANAAAELPVTLVSFTGTKSANGNILTWQVANELELSHYELEKSTDGQNFNFVANIKANGSKYYSYIDNNLNNAPVNYYRLKSVDIDGKYQYSDIIKIATIINAWHAQVNPNPVGSILKLNIESPVQDKAVLVITDLSGKQLYRQSISIGAGSNSFEINKMAVFANGTYFLSIITSQQTQSIKVVKGEN